MSNFRTVTNCKQDWCSSTIIAGYGYCPKHGGKARHDKERHAMRAQQNAQRASTQSDGPRGAVAPGQGLSRWKKYDQDKRAEHEKLAQEIVEAVMYRRDVEVSTYVLKNYAATFADMLPFEVRYFLTRNHEIAKDIAKNAMNKKAA